ncbi:MAG TPA: hypothetical protein ENG71_01320, partial [Thermoplasmatales archaeon]|nr:hypothetical protein [Thermoplasmatales archaeon]
MIKEYLKLSRSFNAGLTAIAPVLGAIANGESNLYCLILFFLVGFFGHCYGFALNDIVDYKIDRDEEGEKARGYAVIYIPPKENKKNEEQRREFDMLIEEVRKRAVKNIKLYYYFTKQEKRKNKEIFTDQDKLR